MAIEFRRQAVKSRLLDPRNGFQETAANLEVRTDPLTGRTGRVCHFFPFQRPATPPDYSAAIDLSTKAGCPFCPDLVEKVTPQFPPDVLPERRPRRGEAVLMPNLFPYDQHSSVCIISRQHFVRPAEFTAGLLVDAFSLCRDYLRLVHGGDPSLPFLTIGWNYLPQAGGSVVHPHIAPLAGPQQTAFLAQSIEASRRYAAEHGRSYWADYVDAEQRQGDRFLGTVGRTEWLVDFTPVGWLGDQIAVVRERSSILDLTDEELADFARGLTMALRYIHDLNHWSFNLVVYSGLSSDRDFWLHARLINRFQLVPALGVSDYNWFNLLHREGNGIRYPEDVAREVRPYFDE